MSARRVLGALALAAVALTFTGCSQKPAATEAPKEIVFSILSAENQASMGPLCEARGGRPPFEFPNLRRIERS